MTDLDEIEDRLRTCERCGARFVFDFWCVSTCQNCEMELVAQGRPRDVNREAIEAEFYRVRTRRSLKRG